MDQSLHRLRKNLFEQLAIRTGLVSQQQLDGLEYEKDSRSLAEALVEQGVMPQKCRSAIDVLVDECLERRSADSEPSDRSLQATVTFGGGDTGETKDLVGRVAMHGGYQNGDFAGYEILEPIGKGGMGVVYKARQTKLNRVVALKMIKAGELANAEEIERFKAEAKAAANLDHPGIVPVHEVGESNGQHFFSMGYIEGDTLADRLRNGPLDPRHSAEIVEQIAEAVAYAHEKQIIHRDLKPGNILMDAGAQPKITDFGLAKQMSADTELTTTGQVLGTPSYMPPEQAAGRTDKVDETADVYSIGAILYCLLSGRPPFQADNQFDTLRQVIEEEPAPLRVLNPKTPVDLETICLKCLEKEPGMRYESAHIVQAELQRYLKNEPIRARRITATARLWRWSKRRPAVAGLLMLLLTVAVTGFVAVLLAWRQTEDAREKLENSNNELTVAVERSRTNFRRAETAIDDFYTRVAKEKLFDVPGFIPLRKELLQSALAFYEELLVEKPEDPELLHEAARAAINVSKILHSLERNNESQVTLQRAFDILTELVEEFATVHEYHNTLAQAHIESGTQSAPRDDPGRILSARAGGSTITQQINPEEDEKVVPAADTNESITHFRAANSIYQRLIQETPDNVDYRIGLAVCANAMGAQLESIGQDEEALVQYDKATQEYRAALDQSPDRTALYYALAHSESSLGSLHAKNGNFDQAQKHLEAALREFDKLENASFVLESVAIVRLRLGNVLQYTQQPTLAESEFLAAAKELEELTRYFPQIHAYKRNLGSALFNLGNLLAPLRASDAERFYKRSIAVRQDLIKTANAEEIDRNNLAISLMNLGNLTQHLGRFDESLTHFRHAIDTVKEICSYESGSVPCRVSLGACYFNMGNLFIAGDKRSEAKESWEIAFKIRAKLNAEFPQNRVYRRALAEPMNNLSFLIVQPSLDVVNEESLDEAVRLAKKATKLAPKQGYIWSTLASAHLRKRNWKDANKAALESVKLSNGGTPIEWALLAISFHHLQDADNANNWFNRALSVETQFNNTDFHALLKEAKRLLKSKESSQSIPKE